MMDVIIYSHPAHPGKDALLRRLTDAIAPVPVMIFDIDGLFQQLRSKVSGGVIIIFLISFNEELERLLSDRSRLVNARFIIVLPENREDMAITGLALRPRYLSYDTAEFSDVCGVLEKMIETYGGRP